LKTYFLSQQIPSLDKLIRKELYFISDELIWWIVFCIWW
jgi:hypothetical protein